MQTIEKRKINNIDESCSEEEEEKNRKLIKGLKKKKDKEQREKRIEDYNEYKRILNARTDEILKERRGATITNQRNREEDLIEKSKEEEENRIEMIEKRIQKMEEMLIEIWELINRMPTDIREEEKREVQRERKKYMEKEKKDKKINHTLLT